MEIKAANKYIVVNVEYKDKTESGIIIPDQAKQYSGEFYGRVISIGNLVSRRIKQAVAPGDRILFDRHEGFKIQDKYGDECFAIRERWCVCKVEGE